MKNRLWRWVGVLGVLGALALGGRVLAEPPGLPHWLWGTVTLDGALAADGTQVRVLVQGVNVITATIFTVGEDAGLYSVYIPADDVNRPGVQGGSEGDLITFAIDGYEISLSTIWTSGKVEHLDLTNGPFIVALTVDAVSGTTPLTVTFTAVTSGTVEGWHWDFGDGGTAAIGPVVQHTYTTPGIFDVNLTVSNTYGSYSVNKPDYITVTEPLIPAPQVDFTGVPRNGDAPLMVQFTSIVTNVVTSYAWTFGDGGLADTPNPTHTYTSAGNFGVTLVVTGPGGTAEVIKPGYVTVNVPSGVPTATFSADVASGTAPLTVTFTAVTSGTVEGWHWDFGDGGTATIGPEVQHTYTTPGIFDVRLTVSNAYGSYIVSEPNYITVSAGGNWVYLPLVLRN